MFTCYAEICKINYFKTGEFLNCFKDNNYYKNYLQKLLPPIKSYFTIFRIVYKLDRYYKISYL